MALFWLAWNAVQCTFGIAPIFVLKSAVIYILSFLEHEEINIWVISCRNEKGGVFGEGVLFFFIFFIFVAAEFKCNEAFYGRKINIAQLFKTRNSSHN